MRDVTETTWRGEIKSWIHVWTFGGTMLTHDTSSSRKRWSVCISNLRNSEAWLIIKMKISLIVLALFNICTCKPFFMNKNPSFLSSFMNFSFMELPYLMWFRRIFISSESCWIPLGILFREISAKQLCNACEVRWYAMHLTCFWNIGSPPLWCFIVIGWLCLHSKAFFVLSMYWLIYVLVIC